MRYMAMIRLELTDNEERARRTLCLLKRLTGLSDAKIGAAIDVKHQAIAQRRDGSTRIDRDRDVPYFAQVLGIEAKCFYMDNDELYRWIQNHRADLLMPLSPWIAMMAESTAPAA